MLLSENFLVKFLPAPEPFRRKDALGWFWGFLYIYLQDPSTVLNGEENFRFRSSMQLRAWILLLAPAAPAGFPAKAFNLLLDFWQTILNPEIWHPQRLLNPDI